MIFSFISLAIALIALILYFGERSKFLNKTDELTADIQKEMEEKLDIQSRYNTLVNDIKKEEEFTKSKKIDEIQLLFTKVNMLDDKLTYFNTAFKNKLDEIISLLSGNESNFDSTESKIENFIPEEKVKITNTQDNEGNKEEIEDNNVIEEIEAEIEEDNNKNEEIEEDNEEIEIENEENENENDENVEEESDIENNDTENIDYEENAGETIIDNKEDEEDNEEDEEDGESEEEFLDNKEQNQFNDNEITTDVLNDIKDTLEDGDILEPTDKEESVNYTDREFESFLNEKKNDINFDDLDAENMDTLADVVKSNNKEKDFNEDLKLNDIDEGFDIKSSIEKLRAQLEQEDKK